MREVALVAGFCVAGAFLLGSIPFGYLISRTRLRRTLKHGAPGPRWVGADLAGALDTSKVLIAATAAWYAIEAVAPGGGQVSAVAYAADQVLVAWQSVALWAGLAALVAHLYPVTFGGKAPPTIAPVLGLAFVYSPMGFAVAVAGYLVALAVTGDRTRAVLGGAAVFAFHAWLAWVFAWPFGWGMPSGPELALWSAGIAGVIAGRIAPAAKA